MINNLVSVIIPTYNRSTLLLRAIESVRNQTYKHLEIIIVDDGSTDNTEEIVRRLKDNRIIYIKHNKNMGASAARNTGVKKSSGEFVAFLDSDDEWLPEKIEKQINVFSKFGENIGMVYSDMIRVYPSGRKYYWHSPSFLPKDGILYPKALNYGLINIGLQTCLVRKVCFSEVGLFDINLKRYIDLEFFIRLSRRFLFYHINEALVYYYVVSNSISESIPNLIHARKYILNKYFDDISKNKEVLSNHYFLIGFALYQNNRIKESKKYLKRSLIIYPLNFKNTVSS